MIEPLSRVEGVAAPLPQANLDTDVIMPKQFLKGITRDNLARGLFYDLRFTADGREREAFILNRAPYRAARFLIVGPNFGCGSSREHAVWGLMQAGIRALIGPSFASIFHDNCFRSGLLPVVLDADTVEWLQEVCSDPATSTVSLDLVDQVIEAGGRRIPFVVDALRRADLLKGNDVVGSTLEHAEEIRAFEQRHWAACPWMKPAGSRP